MLIVVGTSLVVYPAASLVFLAPHHARRILVNPEIPPLVRREGFECHAEPACAALPGIVADLLGTYGRDRATSAQTPDR